MFSLKRAADAGVGMVLKEVTAAHRFARTHAYTQHPLLAWTIDACSTHLGPRRRALCQVHVAGGPCVWERRRQGGRLVAAGGWENRPKQAGGQGQEVDPRGSRHKLRVRFQALDAWRRRVRHLQLNNETTTRS